MGHDKDTIHGFLPICEVTSKGNHYTFVITRMARVGFEINPDGESDLLHPTELCLLERKDGIEVFSTLWEEDGMDEAERKKSKARAINDVLTALTKTDMTLSAYGDGLERFVEDKPFVMDRRQRAVFIREGRRHGINIIWSGVENFQAANSGDMGERTKAMERFSIECMRSLVMFTNPHSPGRKDARQN